MSPTSKASIRLSLNPGQLGDVRFAVSPAAQLVSLVMALRQRPSIVPAWACERWAGLTRETLSTLSELVDPRSHYVPDFLTPLPQTSHPSLADELSAVAATDVEQLAEQLSFAFRLGPVNPGYARVMGVSLDEAGSWRKAPGDSVRAAWEGRPGALIDEWSRAADELWQVVIQPSWPAVLAALEADIAYRGRRMATAGTTSAVLDVLGVPTWDGEVTELAYRRNIDLRRWTGRVVLSPCAFLDEYPTVSPTLAGEVLIVYPCRGRAIVAGPHARSSSVTESGGLLEVVGQTRRRLLAMLEEPQPGHALAARLGLSAATVSYHLARLARSGLVERQRLGREVLYVRSEAGDRLDAL